VGSSIVWRATNSEKVYVIFLRDNFSLEAGIDLFFHILSNVPFIFKLPSDDA
jgi:hypothetical protein